jgi:hypothetical protein
LKAKSPKTRNLEFDQTIIHVNEESHNIGADMGSMDLSALNVTKEQPIQKTRYMTPIGQYSHLSPKARIVMICAAGTTFAIMLAIIVILASVLGSRSGQTKVTLHSGAMEVAPVANNSATAADLSKYDKGL